jgi:hypothetical protein
LFLCYGQGVDIEHQNQKPNMALDISKVTISPGDLLQRTTRPSHPELFQQLFYVVAVHQDGIFVREVSANGTVIISDKKVDQQKSIGKREFHKMG